MAENRLESSLLTNQLLFSGRQNFGVQLRSQMHAKSFGLGYH